MSEEHGRLTGGYEEPPEWFTSSQKRGNVDLFFDGCHRYGWMISPFLSAMLSLLMFAYFTGGINAKIDSLQSDVRLLQQQVFSLAHLPRSVSEDK